MSVPAGTIMIMADALAEACSLSPRCLSVIKSAVSVTLACEVLEVFGQCTMQDVGQEIENYCAKRKNGRALLNIDLWAHINSGMVSVTELSRMIHAVSPAQCMLYIDEFCAKFRLTQLAEKELKFATPCDSMIRVVYELSRELAVRISGLDSEFLVVSKCRRARHEHRIVENRLPAQLSSITELIPIDRSQLGAGSLVTNSMVNCYWQKPMIGGGAKESTICTTLPASYTEIVFPLYVKSFFSHSGPSLILQLSCHELEQIVRKFLEDTGCAATDRWINDYPFDLVVRAVRGCRGDPKFAQKIIDEEISSSNQYRSFRDIRNALNRRNFSKDIDVFIHRKISATLAHMVLFGKFDKRDSVQLANGIVNMHSLSMLALANKKNNRSLQQNNVVHKQQPLVHKVLSRNARKKLNKKLNKQMDIDNQSLNNDIDPPISPITVDMEDEEERATTPTTTKSSVVELDTSAELIDI